MGEFFCIMRMPFYTFFGIPIGKEIPMTAWQEWVAAGLVLVVLMLITIRSALRKAKDRKWRAAERKLTTVLQSGETIKVICPEKKGRVILTSKRLLFENREGFHAVALKDIKKIQGTTKEGKITSVPGKMKSVSLSGPGDYVVRNSSQEFEELVRQLQKKIKNQNQRKKAAPSARKRNGGG